jgi:hypothetical protein
MEREVQAFPEVHDVNVKGCSVFKINERITCKHKSLDNSVMRYSTYEDRSPERVQSLYLRYNFPPLHPVFPCFNMIRQHARLCESFGMWDQVIWAMPNTHSKAWLIQSCTSCSIVHSKIFSNIDMRPKERGILLSRKQKEEEKKVHIA